MDGCTDGILYSTGQKYFNCPQGRGMYLPLSSLQPDMRFMFPGVVMKNNHDNRKCVLRLSTSMHIKRAIYSTVCPLSRLTSMV